MLLASLALVTLALTVLLTPGVAWAEGGVIVIVSPANASSRWDEAERRTRAELSAVGFEVTSVVGAGGSEEARRRELQSVAREHEAVAAVRVVKAEGVGNVEVWLVDRVTGKFSLREITSQELAREDASEVIALRVVELIHASFLEIRADHPPRGVVEPPPAAVELVEERTLPEGDQGGVGEPSPPPPPPVVVGALRLGVGVGGSPGGTGPMGSLTLGGAFSPQRYLLVDLDVEAALIRGRVTASAGEALVGFATPRLRLFVRPLPGARVSPAFGLGGGAMIVWATGEAAPGFVGRTDVVAAGFASAALRLAVRLVPDLGLRLFTGFDIGVAFPAVRVRFVGAPVALIGRPLMSGVVGLEWTWSRRSR